MPREIKFMAWDDKEKKWVNPDDIWMTLEGDIYSGVSRVNNIILVQYVGLKDSKGVEIYEGDIFECDVGDDYPQMQNFVVLFRDGAFRCYLSLHKNAGWEPLDEFGEHEIKIIGNKFENPELLDNVKT